MENLKLNSIEEAIADFKEGKFVIVVDDEDRENEGDLIIAAEKITAAIMSARRAFLRIGISPFISSLWEHFQYYNKADRCRQAKKQG